MIVDNPELGITESNIISHPGDGTPCKHLLGDKMGDYSCVLHDLPWYEETPCFSHTQIERGNTECRIGKFLLSQ